MYGPHINALNVYTRPSQGAGQFGNVTRIWTKSGTQGNLWKFAQVDFRLGFDCVHYYNVRNNITYSTIKSNQKQFSDKHKSC
jgi:hypothetical protein